MCPVLLILIIKCVPVTLLEYSIIVLSGVYDVGSENQSKILGHMTSGE